MSDNQLPQGWDEMMQPMSFDELEIDWTWMADDSLGSAATRAPYGHHLPDNVIEFNESGPTQPSVSTNVVSAPKPFQCAQCPAAYRRLGDLSRHQKEKHSAASSKYLCPIEKCPRGIAGEGFGRNCHLVNHLKSGKHGMDAREAEHLARQHNKPKAKAILSGSEGGAGDEGGVNAL